MYFSYAVGLIGYASEVTAGTEQYFCPIKRSGKILGAHSHYNHFLDYGDAGNLHERVEERVEKLRAALAV